VRGQEHRGAGRAPLEDQVLDAARAQRVEAGRGLVEEDQPRPAEHCAREAQTHAHPLREAVDAHVALLEQVDLLVEVRAPGPHLAPEHRHRAPVVVQQARQHLLRRALAGAVGTEEPEDLVLLDGEGDLVQGERGPVRLGHVFHLDHGRSLCLVPFPLRWLSVASVCPGIESGQMKVGEKV
jgi:hypothetical protein